MLITWKQNLKHLSKSEHALLIEMCQLSKNVYNESLYNIRQHYFQHSAYLRYVDNYPIEKLSPNYKLLGANLAQQTMRCVDAAFKSFFALLKLANKQQYSRAAVRIPHYLPKDGLYPIHIPESSMKPDGSMVVPMSPMMKQRTSTRITLKFPPYIRDKKVHQIHIVPKQGGKRFEARYIFDDADILPADVDPTRALGIDLGISNFATCATTDGNAFILDGRMLKSQNQWYNKQRARLSSIKDKQHVQGDTLQLSRITEKRNRQVDNFSYCAAKYIINYCINHRIGHIVVGYNPGFQSSPNMGRRNNQQFAMLPYGKFKRRLESLCQRHSIEYHEQEESYTSKASFFDKDDIPTWNPNTAYTETFSGKRVHRGLYRTASGNLLNADVNGALNILRKSNLNWVKHLEQARGEVITPSRIRVC